MSGRSLVRIPPASFIFFFSNSFLYLVFVIFPPRVCGPAQFACPPLRQVPTWRRMRLIGGPSRSSVSLKASKDTPSGKPIAAYCKTKFETTSMQKMGLAISRARWSGFFVTTLIWKVAQVRGLIRSGLWNSGGWLVLIWVGPTPSCLT